MGFKRKTTPPPDMSYNVRFEVVRPLEPKDDAEFVFEATGTIFGYDDDSQEVKVGTVRGLIVRSDLIDEAGETVHDACDAHSQGMCDVMEAIWDIDGGHFKDDICEKFHPINSNFIYLTSVQILPNYRGHGVGLMAAWAFLDQFGGGCGLAVCEPGPMQFGPMGEDLNWQAEMKPGRFVAGKEAGQAKLFRYWSRLGFRPIDQKFAVLDLEAVSPSLAEALG